MALIMVSEFGRTVGGDAMEWASTTTALVVVPGGGRLDRHRVGVPAGTTSAGVGVLTTGTGDLPVHLDPLPDVPAGTVAVGGETAARLGLGDGPSVPWTLRAVPSVQPLDELCLEVQVEARLDDVVARLNDTTDLHDRLLWLPPGVNIESLFLMVGDTQFRVREVSPVPFYGTAMRVTEGTKVTVFAPGVKTGVDIIVLADCSGSMSVPDLTDTADGRVGEKLRRIEALRRALLRLLDVRLRTAGRVSRLALVSFTDTCTTACIRFPRDSSLGMAEIDGGSPPHVVQQFKDAVAVLNAEEAGTHIGSALHFAAELLLRHGHPGNDRLIVLISDGASRPKEEDATGEEVGGLEDEVSLMEHLHRSMNIHLHAIGISTEPLYLAYRARKGETGPPKTAYLPNHQLLDRLVRVAGGDPSRSGDAAVLENYFSGLGGGVSRQVRPPRPIALPPLSEAERHALAGAGRGAAAPGVRAAGPRRERLCEELVDRYGAVNRLATGLAGTLLFDARDGLAALAREATHPVGTLREFKSVVSELYKISFDKGVLCKAVDDDVRELLKWDRDRRGPRPAGGYAVPAVVDLTADDLVRHFRTLRHWANHNEDELSPADRQTVGNLFLEFVGTVAPAEFDPDVWVRAHLGVLGRFREILDRYIAAYRAEEARRATEAAARPRNAPAKPTAPRVNIMD